ERGLKDGLNDPTAVSRLLGSTAGAQLATARLTAWRHFVEKFYSGIDRTIFLPDAWTRRFVIDGVGFGVAALNSAWRSTGAGESERGHMLIGERQILDALTGLEDVQLRLVV